MRIFLYEHLTGGGLLDDAAPLCDVRSLRAEGQAMCGALAADLSASEGIEVTCLRDANLVDFVPVCRRTIEVRTIDERNAEFDVAAAEADWTIVIAPEIDGILADRCRRVMDRGGRLLGGSLSLIDLASDKQATALHLERAGVPVPPGIPFPLGQPWPTDFRYPAVWKPLDGAGSQGLRWIENCHAPVPSVDAQPGRLELFCPRPCDSPVARAGQPEHSSVGTPASVAFLCGPDVCVSLPPCTQRLDSDFRYLGGGLPLVPSLAERATRLACSAIRSLPEPIGYVGIDLVLGVTENGDDDVVIEVNPRLTTSYLGLRAACRENLAAAMLAIAGGRPFPLSFREDSIEFSADGR
ncbi:MAG TPA: ATP-grasp domain-containing protein [Pirellulales bacterium]|nr:ATP-grasp domain-containing protein [Pirellulales bacterium]